VIEIRQEQPGDITAIRQVNRRAFGQDHEANIVDALRANGAALLSLVASLDDRVVGHIMYSPLLVGDLSGAALGPMAVLPEYQRQGMGRSLVEAGNQRLMHEGCPFIIVVGHPAFYPRFGFKPASARGITCQWEIPDEVFMVLVLDEARMGRVSGTARYRGEFSNATSPPNKRMEPTRSGRGEGARLIRERYAVNAGQR
jgi:putative acetyltransferase